MTSSLLHSPNNNHTSTDDEEQRINRLFPKCKVRGSRPSFPESPIFSESESKSGLDSNLDSPGLELGPDKDRNANREKLSPPSSSCRESDKCDSVQSGSLSIDNRQSGGVVESVLGSVLGGTSGVSFPGRAQRYHPTLLHTTGGSNVSGIYKRPYDGYHYNISNQRRSHHNHNSCRSPCGIDLYYHRQVNPSKVIQKSTASVDSNSSINTVKTAQRGGGFEKKFDKTRLSLPPSSSFQGEKMDLDNSVVGDEDSGHFDNGTGSGSNGSTFSESNTPLSVGSGSGLGHAPIITPLHDSRIEIEIAGGREIFSQNKTRLGRRGRGIVSSSKSDSQPHFLQPQPPHSGKGVPGRRKVISPGTATLSPRYATKKSPLGRDPPHQSSSTGSSSVWELQAEGSKTIGGPRVRSAYRHYGGSYKQKHKSGNSYGAQFRRAHHHQSFPVYDYYSPPSGRMGSHNNFSRDPISRPPFQQALPRVHGTIKETMFGTEITSVEKSLIYDEMGRLVSCDQRLRTLEPNPPKQSSPGRSYAPTSRGGEIVFDDIEDWREVEAECGESPGEKPSSGHGWEGGLENNDEKGKLSYSQIMESSSSLCPSIQLEGNTSPSGYESDEVSTSVPLPPVSQPNFLNENKRVIGNLPIAEYEGSPWHRPRRYGIYRQPPGTQHSMPNDLDLVDLCSSGVHVPFPSSQSFEGMASGNKSPDSQHSPISNLSTTKTLQQSPGTTRLPGFPQRVHTNSMQAQKCTTTADILAHPASAQGSFVEGMDFTQIDTIENSKRFSNTAHSRDEECLSLKAPVSQDTPIQSNGTGISPAACSSSSTDIRSLSMSREQCDYLYEFSETRKVLEEFFHGPPGGLGRGGISPSDFDELEYTLRRQNGNSYVGQRLAGDLTGLGSGGVEESPKMSARRGGREVVMSLGIPLEVEPGSEFGTSSRLITLHDVSASKNSPPDDSGNRDVNYNDLDVETASTNTETDLGETEIGHQVRHHPRNYAMSPETTDCDSNELESEMSLDYDVSVHSSSRIGTTMPVLEDGLSSANVSDNDEDVLEVRQGTGEALGRGGHDSLSSGIANPTLILMKKQITEIEKEIQMRATTGTNVEGERQGGSNNPGNSVLFESTENSMGLNELSANANTKVHHEVPGSSDRRSNSSSLFDCNDPELEALDPMRQTPPPSPAPASSTSHQSHSHNLSSSTTPLRPVTSSITQAISPPKLSSLSLLGMTTTSSSTTMSSTANGIHLSTPGTAQPESKESISTHPYHHHLSSSSSSTEPLKLISSIMTPPDSSKEPLSHNRAKQYQLPKFDTSSLTSLLPKPSSLSMTTGPLCSTQDDSPQSELHESSSEERLGPHGNSMSPVWVPRRSMLRGDRSHHTGFGLREPFLRRRYEEIPDDDADTDQETDRLLGQHRTEDDYGFYNDKDWKKAKLRGILGSAAASTPPLPILPSASTTLNNSKGLVSSSSFLKGSSHVPGSSLPSSTSSQNHHTSAVLPTTCHQPPKAIHHLSLNSPTAESTFPELPLSLPPSKPQKQEKDGVKKKRNKEDFMKNPSVLIEGVLFRARYLGSTQLISEGQPTKATRMLQAEEAVSRIKAQATQNAPSGLSDSTVSLLSSSSSSITLPLVLSTSTTTDDEPTSPPRSPTRPTHDIDNPCRSCNESHQDLSTTQTECVSRPNSCELSVSTEGLGPPPDSSRFIVDNDDAFEFDSSLILLRQSPSDSYKSQNNSSTSSDGSMSGGIRSRLRIQQVPPQLRHPPNCSYSSEFHYCPPPCGGSGVTGTMFHLRFVGSLEVDEEVGSGRNRRKRAKKVMVEEAVLELKAPDGETQPSTEVDLFISTEKIMVLNTDLKEIMMDHALRTISYIADIGDLVVLMARRRPVPTDTPEEVSKIHRPPKMICHVFESDEAQYIAQSIGQAFQVAYMEFLKANGIEDHSFVREMDYQEVLNSQEIFGDELQMFAKKELQKDVVVPKAKGEILGVVIVESGWGSMLPTVVIANLGPAGAAARCGQLNIGDQIIAINGVSLVGLPLSTCQTYIKNSKTQTVVKLTVVPCPPVVEVKIKRPDTKYQLGFSVQNGVICSLLRGGIAERGGVRVGHRIIEINNQSVVAVPHEKIVNLLATSVGEINMKTMPTSMFRLLTGQETPLYI